MQSKLFDFFPVPKFLSMETSGITVSDGFIQYVTCDTKSSRIRLVDYGELPLADEIIENGGVVKVLHFEEGVSTTGIIETIVKQQSYGKS